MMSTSRSQGSAVAKNESWRRICCPIDFSESSRAALHQAARLASMFGGSVTVTHVYDPPSETGDADSLFVELEEKLQRWSSEIAPGAHHTVDSKLLLGSAPAEIVRLAREGSFDAIVMGTHGHTGLRHLVLGSVAEQVVRQAPCPVVVMR